VCNTPCTHWPLGHNEKILLTLFAKGTFSTDPSFSTPTGLTIPKERVGPWERHAAIRIRPFSGVYFTSRCRPSCGTRLLFSLALRHAKKACAAATTPRAVPSAINATAGGSPQTSGVGPAGVAVEVK
jgi:hypothetical protein